MSSNNQSSSRKLRTCKSCSKNMFWTAKELAEHAVTCKRLKAAGLVAPPGIDNIVSENLIQLG